MSVADGSGRMFDAIAHRYDLLNSVMSFGMDRGWRKRLVRALPHGDDLRILDVATGTADVALSIARTRPSAQVVGLDPSTAMLEIGRQKVVARGCEDRVTLVEGDAQRLPFGDGEFDASCVAFGIRNVPDRQVALAEMSRVTSAGGRVLILELSDPRDGFLAPLARIHVRHVVPRLGGWLSGASEYRYLHQSIAAFPPAEAFVEQMADAGLGDVQFVRMGFGAAHLYFGRA